MEPHAAGATPTGWLTASGDHGETRGRPTPPPHHAVASSKGNAPAWGRRGGEVRTRPPSCGIGRSATSNAGGVWSIMTALWRSSVPCGDGIIPQPQRGLRRRGASARRSLHKPLPHLYLSSASRRQAQCVPRAPSLQPTKGNKARGKRASKRTRIVTPDRPHTVLLIPNSCQDPPNQSFGLLADEEHVS